jgi:hypothetical protein
MFLCGDAVNTCRLAGDILSPDAPHRNIQRTRERALGCARGSGARRDLMFEQDQLWLYARSPAGGVENVAAMIARADTRSTQLSHHALCDPSGSGDPRATH